MIVIRRRMWRRVDLRRFSSGVGRRIEDEGDWFYSREWWGSDSTGRSVFRSHSAHGNGVVSVVAFPSSRPGITQWPVMERWLQQRYEKMYPESEHNEQFKILGYEWRLLRFNDTTRQSAVKIMAAYRSSDSGTLYLMQQPHCLAVPYLKSMVSTGLTTLASCKYDLEGAVRGNKNLQILCIGHGGGSLPLYLASNIQGAIVHVVEIDPVVIRASIEAMGFPSSALKKTSIDYHLPKLQVFDQLLWKGIHERIFLYESDAENFIIDNAYLYDLVFVDAYDGDDIFPRKLWDPYSSFLRMLKSSLHPEHGTVVVNLHADSDVLDMLEGGSSQHDTILPMGKYVSQVCKAYKDVLLQDSENACDEKHDERFGLAFAVAVPSLCNISLIVCRGAQFGLVQGSNDKICLDRDMVLNKLSRSSRFVEDVLDLPFSCLQYIRKGFVMLD